MVYTPKIDIDRFNELRGELGMYTAKGICLKEALISELQSVKQNNDFNGLCDIVDYIIGNMKHG